MFLKTIGRKSFVIGWLFFICVLALQSCAGNPIEIEVEIDNPYAGVDWENWEQHKANLHTHTNQSDGRFSPAEVIDEYRRRGYTILSLTDHNRVIWPWQDYDRDPAELGMAAIMGNELSRFHHTGSYFIDYETNLRDIDISLEEVGELGGVAVLFHPGRYDYPVEWYVERLERYPHVLGLEVYNQGDRYRDDRDLWDRALNVMMPDRPVWGFANDDFHSADHYGLNWNVFPLPELSVEEVRKGMETGRFYFSYVERGSHAATPAPTITNIIVNDKEGFIALEHMNAEEIQWISNGMLVHFESRLPLEKLPEDATYVRARLIGPGGITYTNPFGIRRKER